jgi:hypothetical protein
MVRDIGELINEMLFIFSSGGEITSLSSVDRPIFRKIMVVSGMPLHLLYFFNDPIEYCQKLLQLFF